MFPIVITGKRTWQENGKLYSECFCNGVRIKDFFTMGESDDELMSELVSKMKNACRLMKVTGLTTPEELNEVKGSVLHWIKVRECELPEWE